MAKEEVIIKLNLFEQKAEEKRQQIEELERQVSEMTGLKLSLERLDKNKNKEILANLGKGIFINTKLNDEKVFVNVGSKVLVRKSFCESVEIIDKQISEIEKLKARLIEDIEEINLCLHQLLEEAQKED